MLLIILFLFSAMSYGLDCSNVKPFKVDGIQSVSISVTKIFWNENHEQQFEDICNDDFSINSYDVRGREEEAFYCLHPREAEILKCQVDVDGSKGSIAIVPVTWIRNWHSKSNREYRFHAYATKENSETYLKDIFSRYLSSSLRKQNITLEGALKTGASNPDDGFFVRTTFARRSK